LGSGRYQLMNGNMPLLQPDGKAPFEVDLNGQYLGSKGARGNAADQARVAPATPQVGPINAPAGPSARAGVIDRTQKAPPLNIPAGRGARAKTHPSEGEAPDL